MALHHQLQDRLAAVVGVTAEQRTQRVASLLRPPQGDAAGYWLQLSIAVLIATVGLAQGSTAVVIGAMLIAPLMQPSSSSGSASGWARRCSPSARCGASAAACCWRWAPAPPSRAPCRSTS